MAIFPGEPALASTRVSLFWISLELRMMEVVRGDNWSYKTYKAVVSSSPHNTRPIYRPDALPVTQPTVSEHWRKIRKIHRSYKNRKLLSFVLSSMLC